MLSANNNEKMEEYNPSISCNEEIEYVSEDESVEALSTITQENLLGAFFGYHGNNFLTEEKKIARNSRSLIDLSDLKRHRKVSRRTKSLTCSIWKDVEAIPMSTLGQFSCWPKMGNDDARRRIINLLMLHAWRRRREHSEEARTLISNLSIQVDGLNMQGYLLRQLLDDEKVKTAAAVRDLKKNLKIVEEYKKEIDEISKDKMQLQVEIRELVDTIMVLKNKYKNQENDLVTVRMQADTWGKMLKKGRKKLKALEEQNVILLQEAETKDGQISFQTQCLEDLDRTNKVLQNELDIKVPLLNEALAQIQTMQEKLKISEEAEIEQERFLMEKMEEIEQLRGRIACQEKKLREEDERNGELAKLLSEKTKELIAMNDKLGELKKSQKFWGNRVIRVASLFSKIPIACFYTFATLLLPQPSNRSF